MNMIEWLSLALFVARVGANNINFAVTTHYFTLFTTLLNTGFNFHRPLPRKLRFNVPDLWIGLFFPEGNPAPIHVVGRNSDGYTISRHDPNSVHAHAAT